MRNLAAVGLAAFLAIVAATGQAALRSSVESTPQPLSHAIQVPVGHVGDKVGYTTIHRVNATGPWFQFPNAPWFSLLRLDNATTSDGKRLPVIVVASNARHFQTRGGLLDSEWYQERSLAMDSYSLDTRERVTQDITYDYARGAYYVTDYDYQGQGTDFGPFPIHLPPLGNETARFSEAIHQGSTYTPGLNITAWARQRLASDRIHHVSAFVYGHVVINEVWTRGRVGEAATIAGEMALPLRMEGCLNMRHTVPSPVAEAPFLGGVTPTSGSLCFQHTEWVTASSPYPIRIETRISHGSAAEPTRQDWVSELTTRVNGTREIPWGTQAQAPRRFDPRLLERSPPGQYHPSDGSAPHDAWPLQEALDAAYTAPQLAAFHVWRSQYTDHKIVGLRYGEAPDAFWRFVFSTPLGEGFHVTMVRHPEAGAQPAVHGRVQLGRLPISALPSQPITIGSAFAIFDALELEWRQRPNALAWGFDMTGLIGGCPDATGWCSLILADALFFPHLYLMFGEPVQEGDVTWDEMKFDLAQGTVLRTWYHRHHVDERVVRPEQLASLTQPRTVEAMALAAAPRTAAPLGNVDPLLVATGTFLLVLLAYFWPLIKSALTWIPGYAKTEGSQLLDHSTRETILAAVRADPGVTATRLTRLVKASATTTFYHLRLLVRKGFLASMVDGRHRRYFLAEMPLKQRQAHAALQDPRTRRAWQALSQRPAWGHRELSQHLGISRPATYWHVRRLERAGLVQRGRIGRRVILEPAQGADGARPA